MPELNLLKQILEVTQNVWDRPGTRPAVRKNFRAVIDCGTPALGWEVYASQTEERRCYYRCKSRFCPSCGYRATLLWLEQQEAALPDIPYASIVFTMPRELWSIFRRNRHLLHDTCTWRRGDTGMDQNEVWCQCSHDGSSAHLRWRPKIQQSPSHSDFCGRTPRIFKPMDSAPAVGKKCADAEVALCSDRSSPSCAQGWRAKVRPDNRGA